MSLLLAFVNVVPPIPPIPPLPPLGGGGGDGRHHLEARSGDKELKDRIEKTNNEFMYMAELFIKYLS